MKKGFILYFLLVVAVKLSAQNIVANESSADTYILTDATHPTAIYTDTADSWLIQKAATLLQQDVESITGKKPAIVHHLPATFHSLIIIGSIGHSAVLDDMIAAKKVNISIKDKWDAYQIQSVAKPAKGIQNALVIAGSNKRGAAYGVFEVAKQAGVSPWYWWADVPVKKKTAIYIHKQTAVAEAPTVKYRGIFLNDEAPALRNWAREKFGGFNSKFYEKVFELLLRNKANYLWPAMWLPTIFNEDDKANPKVADDYGIVISTSHHEPMMRAHEEWSKFNGGAWNYQTNKKKLQEFWRGGVERMGNYESVVTVGMRGDGDEGMSETTAVGLLQEIIGDQRKIIADVTGKPAEKTQQVWAIYKEVQDYFDKGMRVADDIIVLFSDDNWGNIRFLPKKQDLGRKGGYGMYYHFDYVGAPVSYRWQNVTQIERVWEQMHLAYEGGIKDLWIVNVGDIKPMEFPISFFMDFAWNPDAIKAADLPAYYQHWVSQQFDNQHTKEIAELLALYTKYNARRIPEMITPETYSIANYREADRIVQEFNHLLQRSKKVYEQLPRQYRSAFYQLIHAPIEMSANLNEMYVAAGKNHYYANRGAAIANVYADSVKTLFNRDAALTNQYHKELENGKWNHMMSQTHMGYTSWNHPPANKMPAVSYIQPDTAALLGYLVEHGPEPNWGGFSVEGNGLYSPSFPTFDNINQQKYFLEIFNRGTKPLVYTATPKEPWIQLSSKTGSIGYTEKVWVSIDWSKVPQGRARGEIVIEGSGLKYSVAVPFRNDIKEATGFVENEGVIVMEVASFSAKSDAKEVRWTAVPNLGRTGSAMMIEPVNIERQKLTNNSAHLEYTFTTFNSGDLQVETFLAPTQDFRKADGLHFAISIDDEEPKVINMNEGEIKPDYQYADWWSKSVADHIKKRISTHKSVIAGVHTLKVWAIDPGVVFQKFVILVGTSQPRPTYLGPPESTFIRR